MIFNAKGTINKVHTCATGLSGIGQMQMGFDNNLYYVNMGDLNTPGTGSIGRWVTV